MNTFDTCFGDCGCSLGEVTSYGPPSPATVRAVQQALTNLVAALPTNDPRRAALSPGVVDGKWGPNTSRAVAALQREGNQPATGLIDNWVISALGVADQPAPAPTVAPPAPAPAPSSGGWGTWGALAAIAVVGAVLARRRRRSGKP